MQTVNLSTSSGNKSSVLISSHLSDLTPLFNELRQSGRRVVAVTDIVVNEIYGQYFDCEKILIHADEQHKTVDEAVRIVHELLAINAGKELFLIGIGGGITTDICGFVASIFKRGVDFAFIPTTLLAMVDASVGGKNGVNCAHFKNMLGVIRQPQWIYVNPFFLKTLPDRQFRCGIAEMLKMFIIAEDNYRNAVSLFTDKSLAEIMDDEETKHRFILLIQSAIQIKCRFVMEDEFDTGNRRLLNLGHTFAHALEHCTSELFHGEAVAIGMILSAKLAQSPCVSVLKEDFIKCGLPIGIPSHLDKKKFLDAIWQDKKNEGETITCVLLHDIKNVSVSTLDTDTLYKIL